MENPINSTTTSDNYSTFTLNSHDHNNCTCHLNPVYYPMDVYNMPYYYPYYQSHSTNLKELTNLHKNCELKVKTGKRKITCLSMILMALNSTPEKKMKFNDLCSYIEREFPNKKDRITTRNTISHTLSATKIFKNIRIMTENDEHYHIYWSFRDRPYCVCELKQIKAYSKPIPSLSHNFKTLSFADSLSYADSLSSSLSPQSNFK